MARIPGMQSPIPPSMFAIGAEDANGEIVGCCGAFLVLHADPLWLREDHRASGALLRGLWAKMVETVKAAGGTNIEVGMSDTNPGEPTESLVARLCERVGGYEIKARFFVIPIGA
jgi:hypothetical protein